jgi:hypothetical protein
MIEGGTTGYFVGGVVASTLEPAIATALGTTFTSSIGA